MLKPGDIVRLKPGARWCDGLLSKYGLGPHRVKCKGNHYGVFLDTMEGAVITWENGSGPNHEVNFKEEDLIFEPFMTAVSQHQRRKESHV